MAQKLYKCIGEIIIYKLFCRRSPYVRFLPTTKETRRGLDHVCIGTFIIPDALCLAVCDWRMVVGVRWLIHNVGAWYSVPGVLRLVLPVCRLNYAHTH